MATRQGQLLSTVHTYLMVGTGTNTITWAMLCDINSFPSPDGGIADAVYSKNLSQRTPKATTGWYSDESSSMEFAADYDKKTYTDLKALENTEGNYAIWIGGTEEVTTGGDAGRITSVTPTGSEGKWAGKGILSVSKDGGETDGIQTMAIRISKTTPWVEVSAE